MIDKANETSERQQSVMQSTRVIWTAPKLIRLDSAKCEAGKGQPATEAPGYSPS